MMKQTGSSWHITGRPMINISASFPSMEPIETGAWGLELTNLEARS